MKTDADQKEQAQIDVGPGSDSTQMSVFHAGMRVRGAAVARPLFAWTICSMRGLKSVLGILGRLFFQLIDAGIDRIQ